MKRGDIVVRKNSKTMKYLKVVDTSKSMIFFKELSKNTKILGGDKSKFEAIPVIYLQIDEKVKTSIENLSNEDKPIIFSHLDSPSYRRVFDEYFKIVCVTHVKSEFKRYYLLKNVERTCRKINNIQNPYQIRIRVFLGDQIV